jgi:oxygen-independent coproporphyrinogen-3 oxidase
MSLPLASYAPQLTPAQLPQADIPGLYVHIPFCFHKCHYCDFYSITRQTPQRMEQFVDRILAEADLWIGGIDRPVPCPRTVFFGGGTPTLLPQEAMRRLILGLRQRFDLSRIEEWTIEANPATLLVEYAAMLRELGVDRLSFGAQSFDRAELAVLERHHEPEDVPRSIDIARSAGFERLNVDLIYAIPGQDLASWARSLEGAIALGTSHLSCYALTYEPNTPMAVRKRLGEFEAAADELELEMMQQALSRLARAGLASYEISNYAASGQECRHNLGYWTGENYIGLGPSAASHIEGWRWKNRPHLGEWEAAIDGRRLPASEVEHLTARQRAGELAMLRLRLTQGLDFADYAGRTGCDARVHFADQIERLTRHGLLALDHRGLRLTNSGLAVADAVAGEFLAV